jgi:sec-independent protein translocase protein TatB
VFDVGWSELLFIGVLALVVVGPKDLPRLMRQMGQWSAKARGMARQFRAGFDTMVQEAELDEMRDQARKAAMSIKDPLSSVREALTDATVAVREPDPNVVGPDTKAP